MTIKRLEFTVESDKRLPHGVLEDTVCGAWSRDTNGECELPGANITLLTVEGELPGGETIEEFSARMAGLINAAYGGGCRVTVAEEDSRDTEYVHDFEDDLKGPGPERMGNEFDR